MTKMMIMAFILPLTMTVIDSMLMMIFTLFIMSCLVVVYIWTVASNTYALITFLIYITGMLVLFSYVLVMTPNFFNTHSSMTVNLMVFSVMSILLTKNNKSLLYYSSKSYIDMDVSNLFMNENLFMYIFMVILLLLALIGVSSISFKGGSPLRNNF